MPETFVSELNFGLWSYGTATETNTGVMRKTIQAFNITLSAQAGTPAIAVTSSSYSGSTATFVITYVTGAGITGSVDYSINSGAYTGTATITANPSAGNATITVPINATLQGTTPSFVFTLKNSVSAALLATSTAYAALAIPAAPSLTNYILFVGDMQAGATDSLLLSGDMQTATDHLIYEGAF